MSAVQLRPTVEVHGRGAVGDAERAGAAALVSAVLSRSGQADGARVRLTVTPRGPVVIQVNLRVCGAPARVQAIGDSIAATIAAGATRLDRQIDRLTTGWTPWPWPDPDRRVLNAPGGRHIGRVKAYVLPVRRACQATAMLHAMDYDAYLFTDADTGEDAVVYRAGPAGVRLARQHTMRPPEPPVGHAMTVNPRHIPRLTTVEATRHVATGWLPFLFFTEATTGRGNLLYRRYDGGLGLITPAGHDDGANQLSIVDS